MFPEQLKKILQLIKQTNDRVIIFDASNPEETFVLMDFNNYTSLITKEGEVRMPEAPTVSVPTDLASEDKKVTSDDLTEEDLTDKINREISIWKNGDGSSFLAEENKSRPGWQIPKQVKQKAQEVKE